MGSLYLTDLADVCRSTGWPVFEVGAGPNQIGPEWKHRARGSGGYNSGKPDHVVVHHTASGPSADGWGDANYCTFSDSDRPLANLYLGRKGQIWVCAAGGTNTNGTGTDPCHLIADDTMNSSAVGVEAGNDGQGEPWPQPQQDCYVALCSALCSAYSIGFEQVHSHAEYAVGRKIDPAGPSRWATSGTWEMDGFRDDISGGAPIPAPPPAPPDEEDVMPRYLVIAPDGAWWVTDMATYRTYVPEVGLGGEGIALFGWEGDANGDPWRLGPGWQPYLDQLPRTED